MPQTPQAKPRRPRKRKAPPDAIRLTADRLVVAVPEDRERRSRSGLLIPATAAATPRRCVWAEVVLAGPDVRNVKPGDRVLFLPQVGLEVELDGSDYLLLRERDVQAYEPAQPDGKDAHTAGQYL